MNTISLKEKYGLPTRQRYPHQMAVSDGMQLVLTKIKDGFARPTHGRKDEFFHVLKATFYMKCSPPTTKVNEDDIIVAPKGMEQCPSLKNNQKAHLLPLKKLRAKHRDKVGHCMTQTHHPKI